QDPDHPVGGPVDTGDRSRQVHESSAFGVDGHARGGPRSELVCQGGVAGERLQGGFGVAASEVDGGGVPRQVSVARGAERCDLEAGLTEQRQVLLVVEAKDVVHGYCEPGTSAWPLRSVTLFDRETASVGVGGDPDDAVDVQTLGCGSEGNHPLVGWGRVLLDGGESQVAFGYLQFRRVGNGAENEAPKALGEGVEDHPGMPVAADPIQDAPGDAHGRIETEEPVEDCSGGAG